MLIQLLYIAIVSVYCIGWGIPVTHWLFRNSNLLTNYAPTRLTRLAVTFFAGLLGITVVSSWAAIFMPLNFVTLQIITSLPAVYAVFNRKTILTWAEKLTATSAGKHPLSVILFLVNGLFVFLLLGISHPLNPDTLIYHVQIIRWTNEYGLVPGIANLFPRFGLGSSWFNVIALFKWPFPNSANYTWLNTTAVTWFFILLTDKWQYYSIQSKSDSRLRIISHFFLLVIAYSFYDWELFRDAANSTNYDFILTALTFLALSEILRCLLLGEKIERPQIRILLLTGFILITFKLSGIFFLLIPIYFLLSRQMTISLLVFSVFAGILVLAPSLLKNYIISGYPFYPVPISPAQPDWQLPKEMTAYLRDYIYTTNRFYNHSIDYTKIPELINDPWIKTWFHGLLLQQKITVLLGALSVPLLSATFIRKKAGKELIPVFLIMSLMGLGWFLTAPSPRFGYGFLLVMAFFPLCYLLGILITVSVQPFLVWGLTACLLFYSFKHGWILFKQQGILIQPTALKKPPTQVITINQFNYRYPAILPNNWMHDCYDTKLPCISQLNPYLQARGHSLEKGFRMTHAPDSLFVRQYTY